MKKLWNTINGLKINTSLKERLFLGILIIANMVIGGLVWVILGKKILSGLAWLFCFMGYPAIIIGLWGGVYYLFNHKFE